jgi:hypothetical protein
VVVASLVSTSLLSTAGATTPVPARPYVDPAVPSDAGTSPEAPGRVRQHARDTVTPRQYRGLPVFAAPRSVPAKVKVLVIRVHWNGAPPKFPSTSQMRGLMKKTAVWFARVSRGHHHVSSKVTPWLRISGGASNCDQTNANTKHAVEAARRHGFDMAAFNRFMIVEPQCDADSEAEIGGRVSWIRDAHPFVAVLTHELGHNLGLEHAYALICSAGEQRLTQGGKCRDDEYGDAWDAMGISSQAYSIGIRQRLGWAGKVASSSRSGTWTLTDAQKAGRGLKGLRVKISSKVSYWVEYRTDPESNEDEPGAYPITGIPGLQIRLDTGRKYLRLVDAAPGNPHPTLDIPDPDMLNAALPPGSSFTTPQNVRITLVAQDDGHATVRVTRGAAPHAPQAPTLQSVTVDVPGGMASVLLDSSDDGGQVVLGYQVAESGGGSTFVAHPGGGAVELLVQDTDGSGSWTVQAVNQVGTSPASLPVVEYTPGPVVSTTPAAGATVQGPTFAFEVFALPDSQTGSPIVDVRVCTGSTYNSCQHRETAPYQFMLTTGSGNYNIYVNARDADGNSTIVLVPITIVE